MSRREVAKAIDDAHSAFEGCIETLVAMKSHQLDEHTIERMQVFQHDLARAIFGLGRTFLRIARDKASVVSRKERLSTKWFTETLRRLDRFERAINNAIRIGKAIGDSFAWLFYLRDTHLLERHLQHQGQLHMPPGIGGQGELAIIANVRAIPDHFVLYHGITTFLRIGDVTLIHLPTFTISGVGELKTRRIDENMAETTVTLIGGPQIATRIDLPKASAKRRPSPTVRMDARKQNRLARQLRRMNELVELTEPKNRLEVKSESRIDEIDTLVKNARFDSLLHVKIGDGLVAVAVRLARSHGRLSTRLLPGPNDGVGDVVEATPTIAMEIMDRSTNQNSLLMERLHAGYVSALTPLLWSPVAGDVWRAIVLQEVAVWTWFNPYHLVRKLRAAGFEVEVTPKGVPCRVRAPRANGQLIGDRIDSFTCLIQQSLFTEEGFIENLHRMFKTMDDAKLPSDTLGALKLSQFYGTPPPKRRH